MHVSPEKGVETILDAVDTECPLHRIQDLIEVDTRGEKAVAGFDAW